MQIISSSVVSNTMVVEAIPRRKRREVIQVVGLLDLNNGEQRELSVSNKVVVTLFTSALLLLLLI